MTDHASSPDFFNRLEAGPFPDRIDPWAEAARFFHQIHGGMINYLGDQIRPTLVRMGYMVGREASLQIAERRQPDIFIQRREEPAAAPVSWSYSGAAETALVEPGLLIDAKTPELDALYIREQTSLQLVTIIEFVLPRKKLENAWIMEYQDRRWRLLGRGVNIVEIDLTRSVKHLIDSHLVNLYMYHYAIHLPRQGTRMIGIDFGEAAKPFAVPLREEIVTADVQDAYTRGYVGMNVPIQLYYEDRYNANDLPFPSLLSTEQREQALAALQAWKDDLARLKPAPAD